MIINTDAIGSAVNHQDVIELIKNEIESGLLSKFEINNIEFVQSTKEGEYQAAMYLKGNATHPQIFTILAYDHDQPSKWLLKLPTLQINK